MRYIFIHVKQQTSTETVSIHILGTADSKNSDQFSSKRPGKCHMSKLYVINSPIKINLSFNEFYFLRYYAAFKVTKFESLFYKINTCLQKLLLALGCRKGNILSKYIIYIFFNFWAWLLWFLSYVISKSSSFLL